MSRGTERGTWLASCRCTVLAGRQRCVDLRSSEKHRSECSRAFDSVRIFPEKVHCCLLRRDELGVSLRVRSLTILPPVRATFDSSLCHLQFICAVTLQKLRLQHCRALDCQICICSHSYTRLLTASFCLCPENGTWCALLSLSAHAVSG